MYKIIAIASLLIRQFCLINPFEPLGDTFLLPYFVLTPDMLNLLAGPVLIPITYGVVSLYYDGTFPAWGSFLFFFFYCVHTGLVYLIVKLFLLTGSLWLSMALIIIGYIAAHTFLNRFIFWAEDIL